MGLECIGALLHWPSPQLYRYLHQTTYYTYYTLQCELRCKPHHNNKKISLLWRSKTHVKTQMKVTDAWWWLVWWFILLSLLWFDVSSRNSCHWDKLLSAGGNRARPEGGDISKGKTPPRFDQSLCDTWSQTCGWMTVTPLSEFKLEMFMNNERNNLQAVPP